MRLAAVVLVLVVGSVIGQQQGTSNAQGTQGTQNAGTTNTRAGGQAGGSQTRLFGLGGLLNAGAAIASGVVNTIAQGGRPGGGFGGQGFGGQGFGGQGFGGQGFNQFGGRPTGGFGGQGFNQFGGRPTGGFGGQGFNQFGGRPTGGFGGRPTGGFGGRPTGGFGGQGFNQFGGRPTGGFGGRPTGGFGGQGFNQFGGGFGGGSVKQGTCPPVRPTCTRFTGPSTCVSDITCSGIDKCCFDQCLKHSTCKPPLGVGK